MQKKVINDHIDEPEFLKKLSKSPLWLFGLLMQVLIGGLAFYMVAQILIGPALVPGLMSAGLIVLAIGSNKILKETLKKEEIIGILIMIIGIIFISLSELSVDVINYNILDPGFIFRLIIFTSIYVIISITCYVFSKKVNKYKGIVIAIEAGFIYSLSSVWIAPLSSILPRIFSGELEVGEIIFFIPSAIILISATVGGIVFTQKAFREGQVNILSPLIGVPGNITPVISYFIIFLLTPVSNLSIVFIILGLVSVIMSSFLLASRQAKLEDIEVITG